jgi:hypothetical protein
MVDPLVRRLIEQVISSPVKLQLVLLFTEQPRVEGTAAQIAQRLFRDMWSVREALHELYHAGLFQVCSNGSDPVFSFRPRQEFLEALSRLYQSYNEPLERDHIQRLVREVASYALPRRVVSGYGAEYV